MKEGIKEQQLHELIFSKRTRFNKFIKKNL